MEVLIEILRLISSGSKSVVVVPSSTLPSRLTAPAEKRSASTSEVFPTPPCPTTATLRILPISIAMYDLPSRSCGGAQTITPRRGASRPADGGGSATTESLDGRPVAAGLHLTLRGTSSRAGTGRGNPRHLPAAKHPCGA